MVQPWYAFPVTQAHGDNGETGVDVGTPFHTLITSLLPGKVLSTGYYAWGGEVDVGSVVGGQPVVQTVIHLDQLAPGIAPGATVYPGQALGLSGGQTSGGNHPTSPSNSTGPHTELDLFSGSVPWRSALDPTPLLQAGGRLTQAGEGLLSALGGVGVGSGGSNGGLTWQDVVFPLPSAVGSVAGGVAQSGGQTVQNVAGGAVASLWSGFTQNMGKRVVLVTLGVLALLVGVVWVAAALGRSSGAQGTIAPIITQNLSKSGGQSNREQPQEEEGEEAPEADEAAEAAALA